MKNLIRVIAAGVAVTAGSVPIASAAAQSQRGQPTTAFGTKDFGKLRWVEGAWKATAPNERTYYQRYRFLNDSTIEITTYGDSTLSRETGGGRVYLSVGRVYHTFGPGRWGATSIDTTGIYFVPQVNAQNTFAWSRQGPDTWTATMRSGYSGHERVTVYQMQRVKTPN